MIAALRPYPTVKDSGVKWLGTVPEHWEVRQLVQIGKFWKYNGDSKADEVLEGVPCVRYGDIYTTHDLFILRSQSFVSKTKVEEYIPSS